MTDTSSYSYPVHNTTLQFFSLLLAAIFSCLQPIQCWAGSPAYSYRLPTSDTQYMPDPEAITVVGLPERHVIQEGETLLDIARNFSLGYLELQPLYPEIDPWIPPPGQEIVIPRQWVLPDRNQADIVINIPELRLYRFIDGTKGASLVQTYPVGLGSKEHQSPVGQFSVLEKRTNPHWYLPKSLQDKYNGLQVMDPGPKNPLGKYWIGLGNSSYGLHGTNNPWSVGRLATNGCIRLYPEHIQVLFDRVEYGDRIHLIYQPVKLGLLAGRIYAEAHPDIYDRLNDYMYHGYQQLTALQLSSYVDLEQFRQVLVKKNGLPVDVSTEDTQDPEAPTVWKYPVCTLVGEE
jgi:L,D-transpeptidase ErfK/SrfK